MKGSYKIVLTYALFSSLWILLSDKAVELLAGGLTQMTLYSSVKGLMFVTVTSLLLYFLVKRELARRNAVIRELEQTAEMKRQLFRELHHRIKNNLQVVIGILNLETQNREFTAEVKNRIIGKLVSMKSVFNIVYNLETMQRIPVNMVLEEYVKTTKRNIRFAGTPGGREKPVETVVSLLLIIDSIMNTFEDRGDGPVVIEFPDDSTVDISLESPGETGSVLAGEEAKLVGLLAESIQGTVSTDESVPGRVRITYNG